MQKQWLLIAALVVALIAGCGNGHNGYGAETYPPLPQARPPLETTVTTGRPGDRWLDTMQFQVVRRAARGSTYGYEVTYEVPGHPAFTLFWPRHQIDFRGSLPAYRLQSMPFANGQLRYPDKITAQSLPDVHTGIQIIERDQARFANGAITAAEMFALVASMGGGGPSPRPPAITGRVPARAGAGGAGAAATAGPSAKELGRALEAAGHVRAPGAAAHHIVAGSAEKAADARRVLKRFGIGINDAANGVFLPATLKAPNPTGAAVHSTLHTDEYFRFVNQALERARTRQEALQVLNDLRQWLLGGGH